MECLNESTRKQEKFLKKANSEIETHSQLAVEYIQTQPKANNEGIVYDTALENTFENRKKNTDFLKHIPIHISTSLHPRFSYSYDVY